MPTFENSHFKRLFLFIKELFTYFLFFYLILFILETIFPGFVNNNFDLNYVLYGIVLLGIFSVFAPEEESNKEELQNTSSKTNFLTSISLGATVGFLIFAKTELETIPKIISSVVIGVLFVFLSTVLLNIKEEEEVKENVDEIEIDIPNNVFSKEMLRTILTFLKVLFSNGINLVTFSIFKTGGILLRLKPANHPEPKWTRFRVTTHERKKGLLKRWVILFTCALLIIIFYKSFGLRNKTNIKQQTQNKNVIQDTKVNLVQEKPSTEPKKETKPTLSVKFLNGNGLEGEGIKMNNLATSSGFLALEASNAAYYKYPKTLIFYKSKKEDAEKVATIVAQRYPKYDILEATESYEADITVILGKR